MEPWGLRLRCVDGFVFISESVVCNGLSLSLSIGDMGDPAGKGDGKWESLVLLRDGNTRIMVVWSVCIVVSKWEGFVPPKSLSAFIMPSYKFGFDSSQYFINKTYIPNTRVEMCR